MYISRLQLTDFKNYQGLDVQFSNNINCLVGNNGVGKTNLLDALYYLSFCKSYFNPIDSYNIRSGAELFAIHGWYNFDQADDNKIQVTCTYRRGQSKKIKFNKRSCATFAEHIGRIPLVIVTPDDQSLITGGSETRRKFIDGIVAQTDKAYLNHLLAYQKALLQRNRLLKLFYENRYFDEDSIAPWDQQIILHGQPIVAARQQFLEEFTPLFSKYYQLIHPDAQSTEPPAILYDTTLGSLTGVATFDLATLKDNYRRDAQLQYTTVGPHKDDLQFVIGDFAAKRFGSQGQQKTFLLALKLAQFEYIHLHLGVKPILLLDDIFDKLDMLRVRQLLLLVSSHRFGQVFITDTQPNRVEDIFRQSPDIPHIIFHVENGTLSQ